MGALLGTWVTGVEVFTVEKDQFSCYCLVAKNMDEKEYVARARFIIHSFNISV